MRRLVLLLALVACGRARHRAAAAPPPAQTVESVRGFADQACACGADRACVEPVRDAWDAVKADLLGRRAALPPVDGARFDAALSRLRQCGDAAGLTIWLQL
jgi:hypothetical protein